LWRLRCVAITLSAYHWSTKAGQQIFYELVFVPFKINTLLSFGLTYQSPVFKQKQFTCCNKQVMQKPFFTKIDRILPFFNNIVIDYQ